MVSEMVQLWVDCLLCGIGGKERKRKRGAGDRGYEGEKQVQVGE